jgi:hypothetical protein
MAVVGVRTRPLVAVISRVPLFVEAVAGAFTGIADVQAISLDDVEAAGLLLAFRPDAVIAEGAAAALVATGTPGARVDLDSQQLSVRDGEVWRVLDIELSPESIRNVVVAQLHGGVVA